MPNSPTWVNGSAKSRCIFDLAGKEKEIEALERTSAAAGFWDDQMQAQAQMRHLSALREEVSLWRNIGRRIEDATELAELVNLEEDSGMADDLVAEVSALEAELGKMEFQLQMSGRYDRNDALLSIHAGAGGTESQDWAESAAANVSSLG